MMKYVRFFFLFFFILIFVVLIVGCNDKGEEKVYVGELQVIVYIVKMVLLEVKIELSGCINVYCIVEVCLQVSGIVLNCNFIEGSDV